MKDAILKLPLDLTKRHFIVGDIHGRYESFLNLLASADYDPDTDIIYTVGDMIDRGPKSYEVLKFFQEMENAYAIKGNHEYMVETPHEWRAVWLNNGGDKCLQSLAANGVNESWLVTYISFLPWVIEVGDDGDEFAFRVLHADLPPEWSDDDLRLVITAAEDSENAALQHIIWGRRTITTALRAGTELKPHNLEFHPDRKRKNFLGHTPTRKPVKVGDMLFVDTFGSHTLTMAEAITGQTWSVPIID